MYDIKVLNNKCKMGGGDVSPQCFVKDLLWVVNLVCKKEGSSGCVCFEQGLSCTYICSCQAGEICRNSNTQMSRNKGIDDDDVDLLQLDVQEWNC
jgi:hypothetical protein